MWVKPDANYVTRGRHKIVDNYNWLMIKDIKP